MFENIREDFGLLRDYGIGIKYNEKYVIDPMFDSDLFTLFDLYMRVKKHLPNDCDAEDIFRELFSCLHEENVSSENNVVNEINGVHYD